MTSEMHSGASPGGRHYTLLDRLLTPLDQTLRTLFASHVAARPNPAENLPEAPGPGFRFTDRCNQGFTDGSGP